MKINILSKYNLEITIYGFALILLLGCSDGRSGKSSLNDEGTAKDTTKDLQISPESLPLYALGRDAFFVAKNDITFPEGNYKSLKLDTLPNLNADQKVMASKCAIDVYPDNINATINKGDALEIYDIHAVFAFSMDSLAKEPLIIANQFISIKNKKDELFEIRCVTPRLNNKFLIFYRVKDFLSFAGEQFSINDVDVKRPPFEIVDSQPESDSILSVLNPGAIVKLNDIPQAMKIPNGTWASYWQLGRPETAQPLERRLTLGRRVESGQNETITQGSIHYSLGRPNSYDIEEVSIGVSSTRMDMSWTFPAQAKNKSLKASDVMKDFYPNSVQIDGQAWPFNVLVH